MRSLQTLEHLNERATEIGSVAALKESGGPDRPIPEVAEEIQSEGDKINAARQAQREARLIAAAPDLLEAAKWVYGDAFDRGETNEDGNEFADWSALGDAIAKAEGSA